MIPFSLIHQRLPGVNQYPAGNTRFVAGTRRTGTMLCPVVTVTAVKFPDWKYGNRVSW